MSNRDEPLFQGTNNTNTINLGITTYCSMKCPNCSVSVPAIAKAKAARHAELREIKRDAEVLRPLKRVHVTGGEPTLHPEFVAIATSARGWFDAEHLTLETNGHFYRRYKDVIFLMFDRVFITHYVKDAIYPGSPDNTAIIEEAQADLGSRLIREPPVEHTTAHRTGLTLVGEPCSKWYSPGLPAGWYDGRLYACCVSFGIDRELGIPVTPDWRERIQAAEMGCGRCCYKGT
jgi:hypothetical protein